MIDDDVKEHLENINVGLARVEQFLPTLATKAEVALLATKAELVHLATKAEVALLATKAELAAAIAPLATKAELAAAVAPLATKAELHEEGEMTRRHMDVVAEHITAQMAMLYESHTRHTERLDSHETRLQAAEAGHGDLDLRVGALERKSRRSR
jgi:hypothetical protein